jgi:GNAT superfamily N-acetyltransferase
MINNDEIIIRNAFDRDKDSIINLLNEVFLQQQRSDLIRDNNYYEWKFLSSPFGNSILTVSEYEGEIVGFDHLWPWKLDFRNNTVIAYEACDSVVKEDFRGRRLLQQMRSFGIEQAKNKNASLMFNFPNNQSLRTNINYGYHFLGKISWWVKIIRPLEIAYLFFKCKPNKLITKNEVEYEDIDLMLLNEICSNYNLKNLITIHRDVDYFKYRYLQHPTRKYGMVSYNNTITAIYTINNNNGIREMVVTEIVGDILLIRELLKKVINSAKQNSCAFIAIMKDNYFLKNLWDMGFIKKKEKNFTVFPINELFNNTITHFSSWNMSSSMHDSI